MNDGGCSWGYFLGIGGPRPGVSVVWQGDDRVEDLYRLPTGHSVYTMDTSPGGDLIACGTRAGTVELLSATRTPAQTEPSKVASLTQGAPVLSVCFMDATRLASTDTVGRCLLWQLNEGQHRPRLLDGRSSIVCAIVVIPDRWLVGLTAAGNLLFWNLSDGRLAYTLNAAVPPPTLSLVRIWHWPAVGSIAYPAETGHLVICNLDGFELKTIGAHERGFCAGVVQDDRLYTIGYSDGLLKSWSGVGAPPIQQFGVPQGVVSADMMNDELLLIGDDGSAVTYAIESEGFRLHRRLNGECYRAVTGPSLWARQALQQELLMRQCQQLRDQILEDLDSGRSEDIERHHGELLDLGAETVSLALRARQSVYEQDILGELRARHRLANIMPDQPAASLARHAHLLETVWQLAEAMRIRSRCAGDDGDTASAIWLEEAATILAGNGWVIETDIPIPVLIEAATIVSRPFLGRWLLEACEPVPFPPDSLTPSEVANKYEQAQAEDGTKSLPRAAVHTLSWLVGKRIRRVEVIIFEAASERNTAGLRPAIHVVSDGLRSAFVPLVLFDAGRQVPNRSHADHNKEVLGAHDRTTQCELTDPWPRRLRQAVGLVFRRLRNEVYVQWTEREDAGCPS